jgi:hypothetical protein
MVNPEVVCHPSMAKTTIMHANSLPPLQMSKVLIISGYGVCERKLIFFV